MFDVKYLISVEMLPVMTMGITKLEKQKVKQTLNRFIEYYCIHIYFNQFHQLIGFYIKCSTVCSVVLFVLSLLWLLLDNIIYILSESIFVYSTLLMHWKFILYFHLCYSSYKSLLTLLVRFGHLFDSPRKISSIGHNCICICEFVVFYRN